MVVKHVSEVSAWIIAAAVSVSVAAIGIYIESLASSEPRRVPMIGTSSLTAGSNSSAP